MGNVENFLYSYWLNSFVTNCITISRIINLVSFLIVKLLKKNKNYIILFYCIVNIIYIFAKSFFTVYYKICKKQKSPAKSRAEEEETLISLTDCYSGNDCFFFYLRSLISETSQINFGIHYLSELLKIAFSSLNFNF